MPVNYRPLFVGVCQVAWNSYLVTTTSATSVSATTKIQTQTQTQTVKAISTMPGTVPVSVPVSVPVPSSLVTACQDGTDKATPRTGRVP